MQLEKIPIPSKVIIHKRQFRCFFFELIRIKFSKCYNREKTHSL